jgi:hypothetical protein
MFFLLVCLQAWKRQQVGAVNCQQQQQHIQTQQLQLPQHIEQQLAFQLVTAARLHLHQTVVKHGLHNRRAPAAPSMQDFLIQGHLQESFACFDKVALTWALLVRLSTSIHVKSFHLYIPATYTCFGLLLAGA